MTALQQESFRVTTDKGLSLKGRSLLAEDLDCVYALESAAHAYPWSRNLIESGLQRYHCWGVEVDQQLVGFAFITCVVGEAELLDFVVSPTMQGQGVGSAFMGWLQEWLSAGLKAERFYLEVRQSNAPAIAVYERAGFVEVGIRSNYYPAAKGREDAILMAMELFEF